MKRNLFIVLFCALSLFAFAGENNEQEKSKRDFLQAELDYIKSQNILTESEWAFFENQYRGFSNGKKAARKSYKQMLEMFADKQDDEKFAAMALKKVKENRDIVNTLENNFQDNMISTLGEVKYYKILLAKNDYKNNLFKAIKDKKAKRDKKD